MLSVDLQFLGDFNQRPTSALATSTQLPPTDPNNITRVGDVVYFTATTFDHGRELWKSDGTAAGTVMVKDIAPGPTGSQILHMKGVGDTLYFEAAVPSGQAELWKSDGTDAGTVIVRSRTSGGPLSTSSLTDVDGTLFFIGQTTSYGRELWKSDGTAEGTVMVKDISPGSSSAFADVGGNPNPYFTAIGSTLYFIASDRTSHLSGRELWKTDGTPEGTVVVKKIFNGSSGTFDSGFNPQLTAVGDTLYFVAFDGVSGAELWKTDGSEAGTVLVKDITPSGGSTFSLTYSHKLAAFGDSLYFTRAIGGAIQLWTSDGTHDGTVIITTFTQVAGGSIDHFTEAGDWLFFTTMLNGIAQELWTSDGTTAGTAKIKDLSSEFPGTRTGLVASGDAAYFSVYDSAYGYELWKSDGTPAGTVLVHDIRPGTGSSNPVGLVDAGGTLFFVADDGVHGVELWASEGSSETTRLVKDIRDGTADFAFLGNGFAEFNGSLIFAANDGVTGTEVWRTDGTAAGTLLVADVRAGLGGSSPRFFKRFGDHVYFLASPQVASTSELWRTDGTAVGTVKLATIDNTQPSQPYFTEFDGALYLRGRMGDAGVELLRLDDTGLSLFRDVRHGPESSAPRLLTVAGGKLFFTADAYPFGDELWISEGTPTGTALVKEIRLGIEGSAIADMVELGGLVYFTADDGVHGRELWRSDGTADGTVMVADLRASGDSNIGLLTVVDGTLYFRGNDGVTGNQVWKLAPGAAAPELLKHIGSGNLSPANLTNVDGTLYFIAVDDIHGRELWKSDGTADGTVLVKDIVAGPTGFGSSRVLTSVAGTYYFAVDDGVHGQELWTTDGTAEGTQRVADLATGLASSLPLAVQLGSRLIVQATTGPYGAELWSGTLTPAQAGDYNLDGNVDGRDFLVWQRRLGTNVSPAGIGADGDDSGAIDAGDLGVWAGAFGAQPASAAAADAWSSFADLGSAAAPTPESIPVSAKPDYRIADAVFAAGDFTRLFAGGGDDLAPRRPYRPRLRR